MRKVFADTNIILDLLARREQFYQEAAILFTLADKKEIEISISALTVANTSYILRRNIGLTESKKILLKLLLLVKVLPLDEKIIINALSNSEFNDFEDCLQYYTAIENQQDIIISRNHKDFKNSSLPVLTALQFITILNA